MKCYYAQLDGNATVTWFDAHLTPNGIAQAQTVNNLWQYLISTQNITTPQSYYVSPLTRCLQTANISFYGLPLPAEHPLSPKSKNFCARVSISIPAILVPTSPVSKPAFQNIQLNLGLQSSTSYSGNPHPRRRLRRIYAQRHSSIRFSAQMARRG